MDNYKNFDISKDIKSYLDSGQDEWSLPEPLLAKVYKYRMLKLKMVYLQQRASPKVFYISISSLY